MKKILLTAPALQSSTDDAKSLVVRALSTVAPCWKGDASVTITGDVLTVQSTKKIGAVSLVVKDHQGGYDVFFGELLIASVQGRSAFIDDRTISGLRRAFIG